MAGALAVAGIALSGHATTAEPRWLTAPSLALHTLAVAFWLGAFWPLLALLRDPAPSAAAVRRFSMLAVPTVALLVATGLVIAVVQVEHPAALVATGYGLLLLAKLAGVAGLITLAARNRLRLTPALDAGSPGAAARLYRSIGMEAALAGVVLAATSSLTLAVPPRVLAHAGHNLAGHRHAPQGIAVATEAGGLRASVEIVPGRAGLNRIAVTLGYAMAGLAPVPKEVWVELSRGSIGPIRRRLIPQAEGHYVHDGPEMAIPGRWRVRIEVLLTDFDQANLSTEVEIR